MSFYALFRIIVSITDKLAIEQFKIEFFCELNCSIVFYWLIFVDANDMLSATLEEYLANELWLTCCDEYNFKSLFRLLNNLPKLLTAHKLLASSLVALKY